MLTFFYLIEKFWAFVHDRMMYDSKEPTNLMQCSMKFRESSQVFLTRK